MHVRFYISGPEGEVPKDRATKWFSNLSPHLTAASVGSVDRMAHSVPFVAIEDFNTFGLNGSTDAARKSELTELDKEFFYFFWRNIGITGKSAGERGSWGLGKLVYPAASEFRTMFGLTNRQSDGREYLMGLAGLGQHEISGRGWYDAFGFYGDFGRDISDPDFVLPTADSAVVNVFESDFNLVRHGRPGLSVVLPFPRDDEILDSDARDAFSCSIIHQFSYAIAAGLLTAEVQDAVKTVRINKEEVDEIVNSLDWSRRGLNRSRIESSLDLARWALDSSNQILRLKRVPETSLAASWDELEFAQADLDLAREGYTNRQAIGVEVPVLVRLKRGERQPSTFKVFLRQKDDSSPAQCSFVRQGLTITEVPGPSGNGLTALVVIEDPPLAQVLRAAENPAHRWTGRADRLKEKFIGGDSRVSVVTSAPRELLRILLNADASIDRQLLADVFPEPTESSGPRRPAEVRGKRKPTGDLPTPPPARPRPLRIDTVDGGFIATHVKGVPLEATVLQIDVAYDCEGADPFRTYEAFDFDLSLLPPPDLREAEILEKRLNTIRLRVQEDFEIRVTGFDTSRDLILRPRWIDSTKQSETE